ncbi:MAG TPA: ABC transporter permease, partial [Candidatus Eisenbacteria bacterium]|nr:ABC transporter permease [Candidatus Eisenbacteria bacterium]
MKRSFWAAAARQAAFYALLLAIWQLLFNLKFWPQYLFPSPGQVSETLVAGFADRSFLIGLAVSLRRLLWGYGISIVFGTSLGLVIGKVRVLDETLGGFFVGLQTLP